MHWTDLLGFAAAFTVLASFCMTTIVSLRSVAIASNVLFIFYGLFGHIYPVFFLHITLLPVNLIKLYQTRQRAGDSIPGIPGSGGRPLWCGWQTPAEHRRGPEGTNMKFSVHSRAITATGPPPGGP
jgi:hypothetical protein